ATTEFIRYIRAERAVAEYSGSRGGLHVLGERHVADNGKRQLAVTLVHVVMALGNLAFVASGVPCHSDRVRNIFAYHEAILISQRYTHGPICEKLEQLARRVEVDRGQLVDAPQLASV